MTGGLAALLVTLDHRFEAVVSIGASLAFLGMALFLIQVVTEGRRPVPSGLAPFEHG